MKTSISRLRCGITTVTTVTTVTHGQCYYRHISGIISGLPSGLTPPVAFPKVCWDAGGRVFPCLWTRSGKCLCVTASTPASPSPDRGSQGMQSQPQLPAVCGVEAEDKTSPRASAIIKSFLHPRLCRGHKTSFI